MNFIIIYIIISLSMIREIPFFPRTITNCWCCGKEVDTLYISSDNNTNITLMCEKCVTVKYNYSGEKVKVYGIMQNAHYYPTKNCDTVSNIVKQFKIMFGNNLKYNCKRWSPLYWHYMPIIT